MVEFAIRVGSRSAQGLRPNNEDSFVADHAQGIYVVADGMGGQERGEQASGMACDIIPRVVHDRLAAQDDVAHAVRRALADANREIVQAGMNQPVGRRMGTTAVVAVQRNSQVYVAGLGDSRALLVRADKVEQLTVDHSVAQALVNSGVLSPEEALHSPWQHVLHKFLGCAEMADGADVRPFVPQPGDRLLLATDGLTNYVFHDDMRKGVARCPDPQAWADHLVDLALKRGSRDNVTCIAVAFEPK